MAAPNKNDEQRHRIDRLVRMLFDGNQTRAAQALDVSPSLISLVLAGERRPSSKLLERLAEYPRVNPEWLIRGQGQPLLPDVSGTLPVTQCLLIRAPGKESLSSLEWYPVAAALERPTRYWLRLEEAFLDIRPGRSWGLKANDLLLIETDPEWTQRLDVVTSSPCVIVDSCDDTHATLAIAELQPANGSARRSYLVRERKVHRAEEAERFAAQMDQLFGGSRELPDRLPDGFPQVVGVCLLLQRRLSPQG